eukprot:13341590-Alexandrium_andersonii.AAC.1
MHVRTRAARQACESLRKKVCVRDTPMCTGMRVQHVNMRQVCKHQCAATHFDMNYGKLDCMLTAAHFHAE